jgi:hypothetical protein
MGIKKIAANHGQFQYQPLPSQARFHGDILTKFRGFSGPIGSGKSQAMAYETIMCSQINPGRMGLVGAPTYPMLRDATQRSLWEALDSEGIEYTFNVSSNMLTFPRGERFGGA